MITRTHITLEETVGEYVVSLHLPIGLKFDTALSIITQMKNTVEGFAQNAQVQAQQIPASDVPQSDHVDSVTQA